MTQGAIRDVKLKSEGRWPTCLIAGCDREAKTARGKHCAAHAARLGARAQDMTAPIRTPCRVRGECSIEGCERPRHARGWCSHHWRRWHRHGDPLASRCPRYTVDELWRLNAYLDSLAGERAKLGDAERLANESGPGLRRRSPANSMSCERRAGRFAIEDDSRQIDVLSGHDFGKPLASRKAGTLDIEDGDDGVTFEARLPDDPPSWVIDAERAIAAGLMTGLSPGFVVPPVGRAGRRAVRARAGKSGRADSRH